MGLRATAWAWDWSAHSLLTAGERLVLIRLADWASEDNGFCPFAEHKHLARCTGYSTGHVRRALDKLCEPVTVVDFGTDGEPIERGTVILLRKKGRTRLKNGMLGAVKYAINLAATPADFGCDVTPDGVAFDTEDEADTTAHPRAVDPDPARTGARTSARGGANGRAPTRGRNFNEREKNFAGAHARGTGPADRSPKGRSPDPDAPGTIIDPNGNPFVPVDAIPHLSEARRALGAAKRPPVSQPLRQHKPTNDTPDV